MGVAYSYIAYSSYREKSPTMTIYELFFRLKTKFGKDIANLLIKDYIYMEM